MVILNKGIYSIYIFFFRYEIFIENIKIEKEKKTEFKLALR